MVCACGNDEFKVIKVYRHRKLKDGRFKVNEHIDSRYLLCKLCGNRYISETILVAALIEKHFKLVSKDIRNQEEFIFRED